MQESIENNFNVFVCGSLTAYISKELDSDSTPLLYVTVANGDRIELKAFECYPAASANKY